MRLVSGASRKRRRRMTLPRSAANLFGESCWDGGLLLWETATAGAAGRQVWIAAHGQCLALGAGPGGDAPQTVQSMAPALGTLHLLAVKNQRLEGVPTILAGVFVQRHWFLHHYKSSAAAAEHLTGAQEEFTFAFRKVLHADAR